MSGRAQTQDHVSCLFACLLSLLQFYFKSLFWFAHSWVNKLRYSISLRICHTSVLCTASCLLDTKECFTAQGWVASLRTCSESLFSRFFDDFHTELIQSWGTTSFVLLSVLCLANNQISLLIRGQGSLWWWIVSISSKLNFLLTSMIFFQILNRTDRRRNNRR